MVALAPSSHRTPPLPRPPRRTQCSTWGGGGGGGDSGGGVSATVVHVYYSSSTNSVTAVAVNPRTTVRLFPHLGVDGRFVYLEDLAFEPRVARRPEHRPRTPHRPPQPQTNLTKDDTLPLELQSTH